MTDKLIHAQDISKANLSHPETATANYCMVRKRKELVCVSIPQPEF